MIRLFFILLPCLFSINATADIYSASNALSRGDYASAAAEFTKLAEAGDQRAQANLGYMYYAGEGVPQDYEKAVYWYRKAATQGNKDAQYNLAVSYAFGEGVKQDLTEAAIWYRRAGEQGHVVSQYSLGISYAYGEGVPQDQKEAARWFQKAADQGYARAQVHLGSMYHTGEGVKQNYTEAVRWYRMAADRGDATAQYNLGTMYRSGKGVEQNYAQAKRWFRQSADQGYAAAQNELASLERSAAASVATRTIQAKPELFPGETATAQEETNKAKPTTTKEATVSKTKTEAKTVHAATPTKDTAIADKAKPKGKTTKKPLFSVDKKDLLTIDEAELDIATTEEVETVVQNDEVIEAAIEKEKETPALTEPEEPVADFVAAETDWTESSDETQEDVEAEKKSGGLFSAIGSLFSTDDKKETETALADDTSIVNDEESDELETETVVEEIAIAEETPALTEPEEPIADFVAAETDWAETSDEITEDVETKKKSGGLFSAIGSLFSAEKNTETDTALADDASIVNDEESDDVETEVVVEEIAIAEETPALTEPEESIADSVAAESDWAETSDEITEDVETEKKSGGLLSAIGSLFSAGKNTETDTALADDASIINDEESDDVETEVVVEERVIAEETITESEFEPEQQLETTPDTDDVNNIEFAAIEEEDDIDTETPSTSPSIIHNAFGPPSTRDTVTDNNETKPSAGFFDQLFSSKKTSAPDSEIVADNGVTEAETTLEEATIAEETPTLTEPEEPIADSVAAETDWAEPSEEITEDVETKKKSGGLFSAIGSLFSANKEAETDAIQDESIVQSETDAQIIAKLEEPAPAIKETELSQAVEPDLSQFSIDAGRRALKNNNYEEALKQFEPLANAGDNEAQAFLGSLYYVGKGVRQDFNEAYNWYKKSAEQNNMDAQYSLGNMYLLGEGVEQNNTDAAKWYALASEQGHIAAKNNLNNLKKVEELNRQNEIQQKELLSQDTEDTSTPDTLANAEEVLPQAEALADTTDVQTVEKDEESGLLGLLGGLFVSNENKDAAKESDIKLTESETISEMDSTEVSVDNTLAEPIVAEDYIRNDLTSEASAQNNEDKVAQDPDAVSTESPSFFTSLFGSNDTKTKSTENIQLKTSEDINDIALEEAEEEMLVKTSNEEISSDATESVVTEINTEETIETEKKSGGLFSAIGSLFSADDKKETDTALADDASIVNDEESDALETETVVEEIAIAEETPALTEPEEPIADSVAAETDWAETSDEITEDVETEKKSGGLFSAIGSLFSADDKKETEINDAGAEQEVAMLEPTLESEPVSAEIDEPNIATDSIQPNNETINEFDELQAQAIQGNPDAQYKLGTLYYAGENVKQDYAQAALWYRRAAQHGNVDAQYSLGNMYLMGEGIGQDDQQAGHWYALAADQGHASAQHNLKNLQKTQTAQLEIETITKQSEVANDTATDANVNTDTSGKIEYEKGLAFAYGDGVPQNDRSAFNLFYSSAEKGYAPAQYKVAVAFAFGEGVRQDQNKAADWYRKAAEQGYTIAQRNLATIYLDGKGVKQDRAQALAWYQIVASHGNVMDIRRRDSLEKQLTEAELSQSQELVKQISSRLNNTPPL